MTTLGNLLFMLTLVTAKAELYYLASADGKAFFVDEKTRDWKESQIFCHAEGMQLATITSPSQFNALNDAVSFQNFFSYYWTAGRDSQDTSQFTWDGTNNWQLSPEYLPFKKFPFVPYQTCVAFNTQLKHQSYLFYDKCSRSYGAICEGHL